MAKEKEQIISVPIPKNAIKDKILGVEANWMNLVQAVLFASIPLLIGYLLNKVFIFYDAKTFVIVIGMAAVGLGYLGLTGIDGMTLGDYLINYLNFNKNKRRTFYNPRVKTEIKSGLVNDDENTEMLPREKLNKLIENFNKKIKENDQKEAYDNMNTEDDNDDFSFEDDIELEKEKTTKEEKGKKKTKQGGYELWKKKKNS